MNQLRIARKWNIVFRGMVLALAIFLVACGSDSDNADSTATSGADQQAVPTVPPVSSTPDAGSSGDELTIGTAEVPATAEVAIATPDDEDVALVSTPPPSTQSPSESIEGDNAASTPAEATAPMSESTPADEVASAGDDPVGTPDVAATAEADSDSVDSSTPSATERQSTGNETFDNPGDGTGGSGMPGERDSNTGEEADDESLSATPSASPVAQFSIEGCDVPDVPNFVGDITTFTLTADVNFRSGPGVECDPVMDEPLGEGQTVEVTGGPVIQSADDSEWVQVEIDGEPGWVTTEFIEPTE